MSNDSVRPSTKTTLFLCSNCGLPIEVPEHEAEKFPIWEQVIGQSLTLFHIICPAELIEN